MRSRRSALVTCMIVGLVGCGEEGMPPAAEPARGPVVRHSVEAPPRRSPPTCKRLASEDGGTATSNGAERDAGAPLPISDADRVISSLRGQFRACYQAGLQRDRDLDGCIVVAAKVRPDGTVSASVPYITDRLSPEVIACIVSVVGSARFNAPGGAGSTLNVPITFVQQQPAGRR